jgi:hypothetical protein
MLWDDLIEARHQRWIHIGEVVWNIEADDLLTANMGAEALRKQGSVPLLHNEYYIGTGDLIRAQRRLGVWT